MEQEEIAMKAKVIKTGEVVEVYQTTTGWASENLNKIRFFKETELDFDYREWEVFRREVAKDILCAIISATNGATSGDIAMAIEIADKLIKQLKEKIYENAK